MIYKAMAAIVVTAALTGCSAGSVRMVGETTVYTDGSCSVTVYQTKDEAIKAGMTREVCVVDGSSAFSFNHTTDGAIKKNIARICGCGVSQAYIASSQGQTNLGLNGPAHVNLVGFE